jgi:hypothetical protein
MNKPYSTYRICISHEDRVKVQWTDPITESLRDLERDLNYSSKIVGNSEVSSLLEAANIDSLDDYARTRQLGEILFEALLDEALRYQFLDIYRSVKQKGGYLRVELDIDEERVPVVAALPWEFLCLPEKEKEGTIWLAANPNIVFSRRRSLYQVPEPLLLAEGERLRIALVVSAPSDLGKVDFEPVQEILEKLEKEHSDKIQLLEVVNPVTSQSIDKILDGKPHIFHFIGHSQLIKQNGAEKGQIAFVDKLFGESDWKDAGFFASLFVRHTPRIVLMQSCEGAKRSDSKALVDVAAKIGQEDIPVVVAMQYEVTNSTACLFALKFYECLSEGKPVDVAVQEGRYKIALDTQYQGRDFATPVLFSRAKDGYLFQASKIDFTLLQNLLDNKKWRLADSATHQLMSEIVGKQEQGYLSLEDIRDFPCDALCKINKLWVSRSKGKFGFSIQSAIYQKCAREYDDSIYWDKFLTCVGWMKDDEVVYYSEFRFVDEAPKAHLPCPGKWKTWHEEWDFDWVSSLYERVRDCNCSTT